MQIVCPHCQTAYAVRPESIGAAGRTVRCARCKKTWTAMPVAEAESVGADPGFNDPMTDAGPDTPIHDDAQGVTVPDIESPSIAADMPETAEADTSPVVDVVASPTSSMGASRPMRTRRKAQTVPQAPRILTIATAAMAAAVVGIVTMRSEVIRLMPQTAAFFNTLGLGVNLRGIEIENVRVSSDKVDGTTMMLVEGELRARKSIDVPRLRFGVRDAGGAEIHSWNAAPEQPTMHVGERAAFKTILASPPPGAREITVRFVQKTDISGAR